MSGFAKGELVNKRYEVRGKIGEGGFSVVYKAYDKSLGREVAIKVVFETGERRLFDMTPYLHRGVFVRLQDRSVFRSARVVAGSVEWPGGIDLSYDTLYLEGQPFTEKSV